MSDPVVMTLQELLRTVGLSPTDFDVLMMGDGAGQDYAKPMGWSLFMLERQSGIRSFHVGGASVGTVNQAELAPYLHGLRADLYHVNDGKLKSAPRRVHIISDSQVIVNAGNGRTRRGFNPDMWASLDYFLEQGYRISFHYVPRNTNPMSVALDMASKVGDGFLTGLEWMTENIYEILPWEAAGGKIEPEDPP